MGVVVCCRIGNSFCGCPPSLLSQSTSEDVQALFNALNTLRIFSVIIVTRALVFDLIGNLSEVTTLITVLLVRRVAATCSRAVAVAVDIGGRGCPAAC